MPSSGTTTTARTTAGTTATSGSYVIGDFNLGEAIATTRAQAMRWSEPMTFELQVDKKKEELLVMMKKRHLNKMERDFTHNPKPDFVQTGKGEVCRSTSVLEVRDLIESIRMK